MGKFEREYYEATGKIKPESKSSPLVKNKKLTESLNKNNIPVDIIPIDHKSIIFLGRNGKRELIGSYVNPVENYTGIQISASLEKHVQYGDWDCDLYDASKFIKILINGDYEFVKILWLNKIDILHSSGMWDSIVKNRHLFITEKVHSSFKEFLKKIITDIFTDKKTFTTGYIKRNVLVYKEMIRNSDPINEACSIAGSASANKILAYIDHIAKNSGMVKKSIDILEIDKMIKEQSKIWYKNNA